MPGLNIHLAVAEEYVRKHPQEDKIEFVHGSVAPDMTDTTISHHSLPHFEDSVLNFLRGKVNLKECLPDFDFRTSFGRGYFLHLVTDYEFYRGLATGREQGYESMPYDDFKNSLYHDYTVLNDALKAKYDFEFPDYAKEWDISTSAQLLTLTPDYVYSQIENLSGLDLQAYMNKVASSN